MQQATAIVGVLIGFLILTQIGIFVCDAMIGAASIENESANYGLRKSHYTFVSVLDREDPPDRRHRRRRVPVPQGAGLIPGFGGQRQY